MESVQAVNLTQRQEQMRARANGQPDNRHEPRVKASNADPLTDAEKRLICGVLQGLSNAEIAAKLSLAKNSVNRMLSTAYSKLGIHSTRQLFPLVIVGNFELRTGQTLTTQ